MTPLPLDEQTFSRALQCGQGRALRHVLHYGMNNCADKVLTACLQDLRYDHQCEPRRDTWLFRFFQDAPEYPLFSSAILNGMNTAEGDDLEQLCELAALMGQHGDQRAAETLRTFVWDQAFDQTNEDFGLHAIARLDGLNAVIDIAQRYGELLLRLPDERDQINIPFIQYLLDGEDSLTEEAEDRIRLLANSNPAIAAYWERELEAPYRKKAQEERAKDPSTPSYCDNYRRKFPLEKILAAPSIEKEIPRHFIRFGHYATAEELQQVYLRILHEPDENVCASLLWVFRRTALPEISPKILQFAASTNTPLRNAATAALAQTADPQIGQWVRNRLPALHTLDQDSEIVGLFIKNFQQGDENLILHLLDQHKPTQDVAHSIGFSLLDIWEENDDYDLHALLEWVYEYTPCSTCRRYALIDLIETEWLEANIANDCLFDSEEEIRQRAKEYLAKTEARN